MNLFDITPLTFVIDLHDPNYRDEFETFLNFYKIHTKSPLDQAVQTQHFFSESYTKSPKGKISKLSSQGSSLKMHSTLYNGSNLWLLKPTEYNQGRGINLFNKLSHLDYHIKSLQRGVQQPIRSIKTPQLGNMRNPGSYVIRSQQFVIQKYVEKPLLIDNRKFDIRVWVLVDHEMNLYCFKEKYIRLSSEPFSLDENKVTDKFIHLTNNAVQKYGKNYSQHENGNIIAFHDLKVILNLSLIANSVFRSILNPKIQTVISITSIKG